MRLLDTNIIVRLLAEDDAVKLEACKSLFQRVEAGEEEVTLSALTVGEVVYVLSSPNLYSQTREAIAERLAYLVSLRGLAMEDKGRVLSAIDLYRTHRFLDFADAYAVAHMEGEGLTEIYSYDEDFDRVDGVVPLEP